MEEAKQDMRGIGPGADKKTVEVPACGSVGGWRRLNQVIRGEEVTKFLPNEE